MHRIEVVWHAAFIVHPSNPVDDPLVNTIDAACMIFNEVVVVVNDMEIQDASRAWIAEGMNVEPNQVEFTSFTWSSMPWVDATALG